ncbi:MAG: sarcosine oxidase subunit delta [Roseiarcus sp.]
MQITCPYCGPRDAREFVYRGDATLERPDPADANAQALFHDYVYLRDNPAGAHSDLWYHASGCRRWVRVERDTLSHAIKAVRFACEAKVAP